MIPNKSVHLETVRGEPLVIGEHTLVPEARLFSLGRARATIGANRFGGRGLALALVTPTALRVRSDGGEQRLVLSDATATAVQNLLVGGLVLTVLLSIVRRLAGREYFQK